MTISLEEIRSRIHEKSNKYFSFGHRRWDKTKRNMFYGATDALLDAGSAAESYGPAIKSGVGSKLLACYGFLQAIYIQQDAVITLSNALDIDWDIEKNQILSTIRETRNRLTGHPAWADRGKAKRRPSSAILPYHDITESGFRGFIYFEDGSDSIVVNVAEVLKGNEAQLAEQLLSIEKKMDQIESDYRVRFADKYFSAYLENGFSYLMQRLWCTLKDEARAIQAYSHAEEISKTISELRSDLEQHGFNDHGTPDQIERIITGLHLLKNILEKDDVSTQAQHEYDLVFSGVEKSILDLKKYLNQLDQSLHSKV